MAADGHLLIGRDEELARISTALGSGGSVLLRGDAGVGKTALLLAHATRATSVAVTGMGDVPLSAFAHIGSQEWREPTPAAVAAALYRATVRSGAELLVVDDAHWLDVASAGLVLQLARSGTPVLAAARTGQMVPRAIQAVLRQGGETIDVHELSLESVRALMEQQLAAPVSLAFATAVSGRAGGNPLSVREVVRAVVSAGAATTRGGVWVLTGTIPVLAVSELLQDRVSQLSGRVRFAVELVAVAGDLSLRELLDAVGEATATAAESAGVIRLHDGIVQPGHPLLRDAALSTLPAGRRARVHQTLLRVLARRPTTPSTIAQRALWRLDGDDPITAEELLEAAELVFSSSVDLSRRLAGAAGARPLDPVQTVRLAGLWVNLGDLRRADELFARTADDVPPPLEVATIALRGMADWLLRGRPEHALALLEDGARRLGAAPAIEAQRASTLWRLGRVKETQAIGDAVVEDESAPIVSRAVAATTLHSLAAQLLDPREVERRAEAVRSILSGAGGRLSEGRATYEITIAGRKVLFEEDVRWAETHLRAAFTTALERGEESEAAQYGWLLGWSLALRGRPRDAVAAMPDFLELGGPWAAVNDGWAVSAYIRALIAADEVGTGRQELDRLRSRSTAPMFAPEAGLAEVDLLAAEGRRAAAVERARHFRGIALAVGSEFRAVSLAWAGFVLGSREPTGSLVAAAARSGIPLHRAQAAFARAVIEKDAPAAFAATRDLLGQEHRWHALEAVSVLAEVPVVAERFLPELRALHEAVVDGTQRIRTRAPAPHLIGAASVLTSRERQVAGLAAQGLSDREIAERLVLSVRTVETHMAHVFAKTGLHRREQLAAVL